MPLPIDPGAWTIVDRSAVPEFIALVNKELRGSSNSSVKDPLLYIENVSVAHRDAPWLYVIGARLRPLTFFPPEWFIVEFECVAEDSTAFTGYETAVFTYAVFGPDAESRPCVLIDWTRAPLSRLNSLTNLDLLTLEKSAVRDYLIFFCNYIGSDDTTKDSVSPFLLPDSADAFDWKAVLEDFEAVALNDLHLQLFGEVAYGDAADEFDLPKKQQTSAVPRRPGLNNTNSTTETLKESSRQIVEKAFSDHPGTPHEIPCNSKSDIAPALSHEPEDAVESAAEKFSSSNAPTPRSQVVNCYQALVWYGNALFLAKFQVLRLGDVNMITDEAVPGASRLPVPQWEVKFGPAGLRLLCRQMKREEIPADELLNRIRHENEDLTTTPASKGPHGRRLRGLRIKGRINWPHTFKNPIQLRDVEFLHDVNLDDAVFERSLELLECRFLRRLSARQATVKGALRLDGCRLEGAIEKDLISGTPGSVGQNRLLSVLDLRGIKIERGMFADQLTVFGGISGEWMRIGATLRARGLQAHPGALPTTVAESSDELISLNLSHTQIDGPLDLSAAVPYRWEPGRTRRTVFEYAVKMNSMRAEECQFDGIWIRKSVELTSCDIKGRLSFDLKTLPRERLAGWWRSRVDGYVALHSSKIRTMSIQGCFFKLDLYLVDVQLGTFYAPMQNRFRSRVGGTLNFSGAAVTEIEIGGAEIGGDILFITGHFSRLSTQADVWIEPGHGAVPDKPHLCRCEANGLLMQDVTVGASMYLAGLRLRGDSGANSLTEKLPCGLTAQGVRLNGGLRFWRSEIALETFRQKIYKSVRIARLNDSQRVAMEKRVNRLLARLQSHINGPLDLRGISTGGPTELVRLHVDGEIHLENSHIRGNLTTHLKGDKLSCSASAFCADIARIEGDCDLRGLEVRDGDLNAHDIQVSGQLLLATTAAFSKPGPIRVADGSQVCVRKGRLYLEGARAARIVLASTNICGSATSAAAPSIVLTRGHFGQLSILGFEPLHSSHGNGKMHFPRPLSLIAVKVDDWEIQPEQILPLLNATVPHSFDGRTFLDLEQRLAKIGKKPQANEVYRQMAKANAFLELNQRLAKIGRKPRLYEVFRETSKASVPSWRAWGGYWWDRVFSGNGTIPGLMFIWLLAFLLPVVLIFSDPVNVEFIGMDTEKKAVPVSNHHAYDLDLHWDWTKAVGLAGSYALPFLSGGRFDVVRARLVGPTCIDRLLLRRSEPPTMSALAVPAVTPANLVSCRHEFTAMSPHGTAMALSSVQFILWILIAGNLPIIARRRS